MIRSDIEIMSPAGSFDALTAAAQGGANAVYFGVEQLNMRASSANNFTIAHLPAIADFCRSKNMRSYLAVNTIIYDNELQTLHAIIDAAKAAGISAVIVSDQAAIAYAHSRGVEVHLSTQLNISNVETLKFYASYADVAVLARELSLDQTAYIARQIKEQNITGPSRKPLRLELFVHGALCMAISGKCYLSLHEHGYSANRGSCLQNCRRAYTVTERELGYSLDIENEYIMSPKDLCTIAFLDKILAAGVTVLKIEGRARPAEYVRNVTQCYSEAVQAIIDGTFDTQKVEQWTLRLSEVFNRGFWDGYYLGSRLGEWTTQHGSQATKRRVYLGKCINYYKQAQVAELQIESDTIQLGDEILITGPTTGAEQVVVQTIRINNDDVKTAIKGQIICIKIDANVRRSDKVFKLVASE